MKIIICIYINMTRGKKKMITDLKWICIIIGLCMLQGYIFGISIILSNFFPRRISLPTAEGVQWLLRKVFGDYIPKGCMFKALFPCYMHISSVFLSLFLFSLGLNLFPRGNSPMSYLYPILGYCWDSVMQMRWNFSKVVLYLVIITPTRQDLEAPEDKLLNAV